jgi:hypothetical protein
VAAEVSDERPASIFRVELCRVCGWFSNAGGGHSDPRNGVMKLSATQAVRSVDTKRPLSLTMEAVYCSEMSESVYVGVLISLYV